MFKSFKVIIVLFVSSVLLVQCTFGQKINVAILYESLCPDSLKFVNEQLYPNWAEISPFVHINFVPFGKSSSKNGGKHFNCQHGPMECAGNKIQSCALGAIFDPNSQVEFVHCFMNSFAKTDVGQQCAANVGLNWDQVEQCYNSQSGTLLQLQAEAVTKSVSPKFVPTIVFNQIFKQEDQNESIRNFKGVICKYLDKLYPGVCR